MKSESMVEIGQGKKHRPMLRNKNINYSRGTFFVTMQAAFNKTIFGAIVGEKCVLNEFGEAVAASLQSLGERYAGVEIDEFVVMPNHVHFIVNVGVAGTEPRHPDMAADAARRLVQRVYLEERCRGVGGRRNTWPYLGVAYCGACATAKLYMIYMFYMDKNKEKKNEKLVYSAIRHKLLRDA